MEVFPQSSENILWTQSTFITLIKIFCILQNYTVEIAQMHFKGTSFMSGCQSFIHSQFFLLMTMPFFPVQLISVIIPLHIQKRGREKFQE